ncbi:hypothetical protein GR217_37245 [Rhizobium leguminosarum]|uniref:T6SS Phospholipase effector Tle1-like catalytic domain-containing protein n=1 Tax=Rhizobium ruizarguesonis TaxID=2081791 RepID=A0AAE5C699_9HYPH|nr:hypothetical protein [Rhizobium ruizarguesonis]
MSLEPRAGQPTRDTVEVWFPGVHADVGGGYACDALVHQRWQSASRSSHRRRRRRRRGF